MDDRRSSMSRRHLPIARIMATRWVDTVILTLKNIRSTTSAKPTMETHSANFQPVSCTKHGSLAHWSTAVLNKVCKSVAEASKFSTWRWGVLWWTRRATKKRGASTSMMSRRMSLGMNGMRIMDARERTWEAWCYDTPLRRMPTLYSLRALETEAVQRTAHIQTFISPNKNSRRSWAYPDLELRNKNRPCLTLRFLFKSLKYSGALRKKA